MPAWEQLCEKCLEPGIVGREHHEDEHDGVDQHTVICELAQCLGQDGQRGGGEEAAPDVAKPAEHHEHQHKDGGVEVELDRLERGIIQTVERAGRAGEGGRGDEGHELILREVQSDGLRGDGVVADGHDGAARAGAREIEHDDERHHHKDEARGKTRDGLGAGRALRALDDGVARGVETEVVDRLGAGNIEEDVQARSVIADEQAVDQIRDDLAEGERHDGEVVTLEPQHRRTDEQAHDGGEDRADDHGDGKAHRRIGDRREQALRDDDAAERAYAHKARVAEAQLTEDADGQVQRDRHGHIAADGYEQTDRLAVEHPAVLQNGHDDEDGDHAEVSREVDLGGLFQGLEFRCQLCHSCHLTLSPAHTCRGVPRA